MNKTSAAIVRTLLLGTSCLSALALSLSAVKADPSGGVVVSGSAVIGGTSNNTVINQSTNRALINWQNFSVAAGGSVRFNQPNGSSITVNRVVGSEASSINGSMFANGNVWLLNGNGILFGQGSSINVGGLLATTSDINTRDFENGSFNFTGGTGASVVNQGTIRTTAGGTVVLSGSSVSNQGLISAQTGTVVLGGAAAFTVDFVGDGLIKYAITAPARRADNGQTGVSNTGTIAANNGGRVLMTARAAAAIADAVVNNKGLISATSATVRDGIVILDAGGGTANVSGSIDVSGARRGQTGGTVAITGSTVNVADGTRIDASGDAGGGTVLIGGDAHGQGDLATADNVTVGAATVSADAVRSGDGGKLVVWSNGITDFSGIFSAMGGAQGGNGGFVETSGHDLNISHSARVTTLAPKGHTGNWLIDPTDINIVEGGADGIGGANIDPDDIIAALAGTNVTLEADNDITVTDALNYTSANTLSLLAQNNIFVNANIANVSTGAVNLVAGWDGSTLPPSSLIANGVFGVGGDNTHGNVAITNAVVGSANGTVTVAGWKVALTASSNNAVAQIGYTAGGSGDIVVATVDALNLQTSSGATNALAQIGNGDKRGGMSSAVSGDITLNVGGNLSFALNQTGIGQAVWIGNSTTGVGKSGNVTITAFSHSDNSTGGPQVPLIPMLAADTAYGDVFFGIYGTGANTSLSLDSGQDVTYNSSHALSLLADGIVLQSSLLNSGSGAINLIAGWNGTETRLDHLTDAGVFANNGANIYIQNGSANVSVGSAGGKTTLAASTFTLRGESGFMAQLGYNGVGGGDIFVKTVGGAAIQYDNGAALLGNGSVGAAISGDITGNITLDVAGQLTLSTASGVHPIYLGNYATSGHTTSGDLTVLTSFVFEDSAAIETNIAHALAGGDVTLGARGNDLNINGAISYDSGHTLNLLSIFGVDINDAVTNVGSGNINLVAGWNTTTLAPGSFTTTGVYGNNGALLSLDGAVSTATGVLTLASHSITQSAAIAAGRLDVFATGTATLTDAGNLVATASFHVNEDATFVDDSATELDASEVGGLLDITSTGGITQTGTIAANGLDVTTQGGGNVTLDAYGNQVAGLVTFHTDGAEVTFKNVAAIQLGATDVGQLHLTSYNGGLDIVGVVQGTFFDFSANGVVQETGAGALQTGGQLQVQTFTGAITLDSADNNIAAGISLTTDGVAAASITNGTDTRFAGSTAGTLTVHSSGAVSQLNGITATNLDVTAGTYIQLADSQNHIGHVTFYAGDTFYLHSVDALEAGDGTASGGISLLSDAALTIDGHLDSGINGTLLVGNGVTETVTGYIKGNGLSVGGNGGEDVTLDNVQNALTGTLTIYNPGGESSFTTGGSVTLGAITADDLQIESGGAISVDDTVTVANFVTLTADNDITQTVNGSFVAERLDATSNGGSITLTNGTNAISDRVYLAAGGSVSFRNANGFTLGDSSAGDDFTIDAADESVTLDGAIDIGSHKLTITADGDIVDTFDAAIQAGDLTVTSTSGGAFIDAGDNSFAGTVTFDVAMDVSFFNDASVTLGASTAGGSLGIRTYGGITVTGTVSAGSISLESLDTGDIDIQAAISADDDITLQTATGSITQTSDGTLTATTLFAYAIDGNLVLDGAENAISDTVSLFTQAGDASFTNAIDFTVQDTVVTGLLTLTATTGDITLSDGDFFGVSANGLTVTAQAGGILITGEVESCGCGAVTLMADGNITETADGFILADDLTATSSHGSITLANDWNELSGIVSLNASEGDATVFNSGDFDFGTSVVGGTLRVETPGGITQSGAITAGTLELWSYDSGDITLEDAGNAVGAASFIADDGSVTFVNSAGFELFDTEVEGHLTVTADAGDIVLGNVYAQTGLDVTATLGGITLDGDVSTCGCGSVTLWASGDIIEGSGTLETGGDATITSDNGDIVFLNENHVLGTLRLSAHRDALFGNNDVTTLGQSSAGRSMFIGTEGDLTQTGALTAVDLVVIALPYDNGFDIVGSNVTLDDTDNDISGRVAFMVSGGVTFVSNAGFTLGDVTLNGFNDPVANQIGADLSAQSVHGGITIDGAVATGLGLDCGCGFDPVLTAQGDIIEVGDGFITGGDITATSTSGNIVLMNANNVLTGTVILNAAGDASFATSDDVTLGATTTAGNFTVLSQGDIYIAGSIQNAGNITLIAGWDGTTTDAAHLLDDDVYGNGGGEIEVGGPINIAVGSASGTTTLAAADIEITPTFGYHQIGYHGAGGGDIVVRALGDLELTAGASAGSHAHIGNGSLDADIFSNVTGNIDIRVAGLTTLHGVTGGPKPWIGNAAAPGFASGDVQLVTGDLDANVSLNAMLASDISGGNVTVGLTDAGAQSTIGAHVFYDSAHVLSILTAGSVEIGGSIQNDGTGAINIIAGWDGTTLDATHFGDVGVSGNGNGSVTIGGASASGDAAIGSALGTTSIAGRNVTLSAVNGLAQAGYYGSSTGMVRINATGGTLALAGGNAPGLYAQVGGGSSFGLTSSDPRGDVTVVAGNMTAANLSAVTADALKLILTGNTGAIGSAISPIKFASNSLAVQTVGRNVFLASPNQGVLIGGTGIALSGGSLRLAAGGPITQTAAVLSGTLDISTTAGAITLTNGGNGFGALTATTAGSNNASFTHSSQLTVASANVGGTLTLNAGTGINQSGAIHAAALTVSSQNGAIVLGNAGNSFATLTATTQNTDDATFTDSVGVTVASANVGGKLTVAAGGAIGQSGAIHAGSLAVSTTSGAITLTHAGNNFGALSVTTAGADNANLFNGAQLTVAGANVGGVLTLASSAGIGQTGGIHAAGLSVTSANGAIVLTRNDNSFAALSVNTQNSDNASITDGSALSVSGANVGGSLHLLTAGALGQSGAIHTASLDAATTLGAITLTNAGNLFGTLTVSTLGAANASLVNSGALGVTSANVGGLLTLATNGALTQTGAVHAGSLDVSTTAGAITLTDAGNVFGGLTAATTGSDNASFRHASQLTVAGANVGGTLVLNAGGGINQSGAIHAAALNATSANGAIVLGNAGNSFATLTVSTQNADDASFTDSVGVTVASANVGGKLTVAAGGAIGQSGAIHAAGLNVSTTSGAIVLTNAGNAFGALNVSTQGTDDASLVDSTALGVTGANVGGLLTLVTGGALTQTGAIHAGSLNVSTTAGAITLTHAGNAFGGLTVATTGSNGASFTHAGQLSVVSANVGGTLTLHAGAGVNQSGAIHAAALDVSSSNGAIQLTNAGNSFASLTAATQNADNAAISDSIALVVSGADIGGTLTLAAGGAITQSGAIHAGALGVSATSGAITLTNAGNAFGSLTVATAGSAAANLVDSTQLTVAGANVGGTLTLHSGAGIDQTGAIHAAALDVSSSNGAILLGHGGNSFATLAVATQNADDATVADSGALQVVAADVGGKLTLIAGGPLTQSVAIHAGSLDVSTTTGDITLTNTGNDFGGVTVTTAASNNASLNNSALLTVVAANVGGTLTLTAAPGIAQSGAIVANALELTSAGAISLTNAGNSFGTLTVTDSGTDAAAVRTSGALAVAGANTGGLLALTAGGNITQTGTLTTHSLSATTSTGGIAFNNTGNVVSGTVQLVAPGTVTLYNTSGYTTGTMTVGGDLTLLSRGSIVIPTAIQNAGSGAITVVAGWDGITTAAGSLTNAGVFGNNSGSVTIAGAAGNVAVGSKGGQTLVAAASITLTAGTTDAGGYAQLGYHGSGGGAIRVAATQGMTLVGNSAARFAMVGNGSLGSDVTGNQTGDIDVRLGGDLTLNGPTAALWFGNLAHSGTASGNVVLIANDIGGTGDAVTTSFVAADLVGGDVTLGFTGTGDQGPDQIVIYNSSHTLNLLAAGNVSFAAGVQNAGTGAINVVAGWDRITLTPASFGSAGVYGNNGKGVLIGTAQTTGDVPVGSFGGKTSVYGAALTLAAVNGFAQLGYHGHGNGAVLVKVTGGVTLSGGAGLGQFAQLGNGGFQTIGNNSGDITIAAGGDIALNGGAGVSAYAQVGNGGGESNLNSTGYSNTGATTLTATNVLLTSGAGSGAYTMIGNGGLRIGFNLSGNAINSGNISVVVSHDVTVAGGAGLDAFAQIGNGGSESNLNPTAASTGSSTGDIVIQAPSGPDGAVTLAAGAGGNAYSQIGNGGFAANYGPLAVAANFLMSGNITVTDLALSGGNTGSNAYALIGNGDATRATIGNVGGAIVIDVGTGTVSYTHGTAAHTPATIGNITGNGTNTGSLVGATPPSDLNEEPVVIGIIAGGTKPPPNNGITTIATVVVASNGNPGATNLGHRVGTPGPIASLEGGGPLSGADSATVVIADSLDGARKPVASQMLLGGILKQAAPYNRGGTVHGVPPADQDFSSWGNEALWQ